MGKRLGVLSALDGAKTSWYYFTTVVIAGMGFFTDAYNLLCITTVTKLLGRIYYYRKGSSEPGTLPGNVNAAVTGVALIGTLVGQLFFGWLGDKLGRKKVCGLTLMLMATSSIGSGLSFGRTSGSVMTTLCFFRFWLGFGVGGDYPLSATIMSEHANKKTRGAFIAAVFAMQGFGILAGGAVAYFVSSAFMQYEKGNQGPLPVKKADYVWRIILMLGAVRAALTLYWRMKMPETSRYTALVEKNAEQAAADMSKVLKGFGILAGGAVAYFLSSAFMQYEKGNQGPLPVKKADYVWRIILMLEAVPAALTFYWRMKMPETGRYTALVEKNAEQVAADMSKVLKVDIAEGNIGKVEEPHYHLFSIELLRRHGLHLLGTSSTWFLLDVAFYSQSLFQNDMFSNVGWIRSADKLKAIEEVNEIASAQAKIAMLSIVPGYWFTVFLIDHIGRFAVQLIGFSFMTIFMFALSIPYDHWKKSDCQGFVALYALTFFFANFGPNSTTFIVPAELFPARLRSTCHGISAAAGKAGAIVGNFGIGNLALKREKQQKLALIILAVTNALGFLFTFLVPETNGEFFENISGENDGGGEEKG